MLTATQSGSSTSLDNFVHGLEAESESVPRCTLRTLGSVFTRLTIEFIRHKAGHHDTTVHEKVAPAVTEETVIKHRHEEAQTAIDREVHQDHFHTSIQPVKDREVLPEQHQHNMAPVEHRELHHGDSAAVQARLEQERAQFQSTRTSGGVKESHSVAPVIAGEHVHHHVHEVSHGSQRSPSMAC